MAPLYDITATICYAVKANDPEDAWRVYDQAFDTQYRATQNMVGLEGVRVLDSNIDDSARSEEA